MNLVITLPTSKPTNESHHPGSVKGSQNQASRLAGDHQHRDRNQVRKLMPPNFLLHFQASAKTRIGAEFSNFDVSLFSWGHIPPSKCRSGRSRRVPPR